MRILIFIDLLIIALFFLFGWAIVKKKMYSLISGFNTHSPEEQEQLIKNGLPQKTGKLLIFIGIGMLILLPLSFTPIKHAMEIQWGFFIFSLFVGMIYLSKYEIESKRKRTYIITSNIAVITITFIVGLMVYGYKSPNIVFEKKHFEITGMYGDKWNYEEIEDVQLINEMPDIIMKTNGFDGSTMLKGHFKLEKYNKSLLFIHTDSSPYIYLKLHDQHLFINNKDPETTKMWYAQLKMKKME